MSITISVITTAKPVQGFRPFFDAIHRLRAARRQRRDAAALRSLDPRTLKDMGICRSEVNSVVYGEAADRKRKYSGAV